MTNLYRWLEQRPEQNIAVVSHWGVMDWLLGQDFDNCELRVVPFEDIQPSALAMEYSEEMMRTVD
jgi:hypothetical protein